MDCGPTCLRMIARFYGRHYSLQQLREKSHVSREGVSLLGISDAAEAIGLRTLAVKIPFEKLIEEATLPCIAHWNQSHFVVVYQIKSDKIIIADPAVGKVACTYSDFRSAWLTGHTVTGERAGLVLLLEPTPLFSKVEPGDVEVTGTASELLAYLKNYRQFISQLVIGLLVGSAFQLVIPFLTQSVVDVGINTRNINFIYLILAAQITLFIARTSVEFIRRWILLHLSTRINISLISDFLSKLFRLPLSFYDSKVVGDVLQRVEDHTRIQRLISSSSLSIVLSAFNIIVFAIVLLFYSYAIFLVFFVFSAASIFYVLAFMKKRAEVDHKRFGQLAVNQSNLIQLISGMSEIKLNNCETQKRWEWERIQAKMFRLSILSTKIQQYQDAGHLFMTELKNIIVTFMSALAVIHGDMTLGMMLAVQYIIGALNGPINDFVVVLREWQDAKISLERIREVRSLQNEDDTSNPLSLIPHKGQVIVFDHVTFHYEGGRSPKVLNDISFTIPVGKVTAIVGTSGSGKTTLLKLLLKFYSPTSGKIILGGRDLESERSTTWRKQCGAVLQDGFIFNDTIANNIALSSERVDVEKLLNAVKIASVQEFIESLPLGYNTVVGANGVGLSQGQKQRLLIARAVYKDPDFLFFDEATSSLDANNERAIMASMDSFFRNRTVLIIAHRLSTVKNADQIIVLERGEIVEIGSHSELIKSGGKYFELIKNQLELGS